MLPLPRNLIEIILTQVNKRKGLAEKGSDSVDQFAGRLVIAKLSVGNMTANSTEIVRMREEKIEEVEEEERIRPERRKKRKRKEERTREEHKIREDSRREERKGEKGGDF